MAFLQELRRRKVFRVAALYIVSAWVVLQVADLAFESWDISSSALRYVWLGAIIGFPVALIFGWRYDITAHGIVRTSSAESSEPFDLSLHRADYVILTLLLVVAIGVIYQVTIRITGAPGLPETAGIIQQAIEPNSIAVLPLDNISGIPEQAYFVSGMQDALIAGLSGISALRVTSKTSTLRYRESDESLPVIAEQLGVAKLIEGSVFRVGNRIRINVNLVDALLDKHIWAETFEEEVEDVMVLQNSIAKAIAQQVEVTITPTEQGRLDRAKRVNPEAFEAYLKVYNIALEAEGGAEAVIRAAERVIELDPEFALGYALLADLYGYLALMTNVSHEIAYERSREYALKAVELDPDLSGARMALARFYYQFEWNWATAEAEFRRGLELDPNNVDGLAIYGSFNVLIHKDCDKGLGLLESALSRDPFQPSISFDLGVYNFHCRRLRESIRHFERVNELLPGFYRSRMMIAWNYSVQGLHDKASAHCDAVLEETGDIFNAMLISSCAWVYSSAQQEEKAQSLWDRLDHPPDGVRIDPFVTSFSCLAQGDVECALTYLEQGFQQRSSNLIFLRTAPAFDPIRDHPRFQAILKQMNFPPEETT